MPTLGDDIVFVEEPKTARPFKRLYKIAATVLSELGRDPRRTPCWVPDSEDAWFDPADEGGWGIESPVGLLAVVRYQKGAPIAVRSLPRPEALAVAAVSRPRDRDRRCAARDGIRPTRELVPTQTHAGRNVGDVPGTLSFAGATGPVEPSAAGISITEVDRLSSRWAVVRSSAAGLCLPAS